MLQQKKLTSAVAIALGASVVALSSAQAGTILFPQIAVGPAVTTIVSVMNAGEPHSVGGETLHYRYYWKKWESKADNADDPNTVQVENKCVEKNRYLPTSKNDLQTFDISGEVYGSAGRGVMFNDQSVNNDWDKGTIAYDLGDPATLAGNPAAHRAFLLVDNNSDQFFSDLAGEAIVSEVVNGATWGYQAFQNQGSEDYDFWDFASNPYSLVAFMPADEVTTRFLATVLNGDMAASASYTETTHLGVRVLEDVGDEGGFGPIVAGAYDRDENFRSGGVDRPVTCVGAWDIEDMFPDAINDLPEIWGWTNVTNYEVKYGTDRIRVCPEHDGPSSNSASMMPKTCENAAVFKVEYGDQIDGVSVNGIFNNGIYLHPAARNYAPKPVVGDI